MAKGKSLFMTQPLAIGVDIGGTKLAFALVTERGEVLDSCQMPTLAQREPEAVIKDIATGISRMRAAAPGVLPGIGIGVPGQIIDGKVVRNAVNLGWKEVYLAEQLKTHLDWNPSIHIMKDADASLWGEYHFGAARNGSDCLYLCIGSGLGGSIIANRQLLAGAHGTAADVGHMFLEENGLTCSCGLKGCAETVVSGPGLVNNYRRLAIAANSSGTSVPAQLSAQTILQAARAGDPLARQAFSLLARGLGKVISFCISLLNPESIILGGGLALAAFDIIVPEALEEVKLHTLVHSYEELQIIPSGFTSSAVGPASLVWFPDA
jgi:glucokinase